MDKTENKFTLIIEAVSNYNARCGTKSCDPIVGDKFTSCDTCFSWLTSLKSDYNSYQKIKPKPKYLPSAAEPDYIKTLNYIWNHHKNELGKSELYITILKSEDNL